MVEGVNSWADLWHRILEGFDNPLFFLFSVVVGFALAVITHVAAGVVAEPIVRLIKAKWRAIFGDRQLKPEGPIVVLKFKGREFIPGFNYRLNRRLRWFQRRSAFVKRGEDLFQTILRILLIISPLVGASVFITLYFDFGVNEHFGVWEALAVGVAAAVTTVIGGAWMFGMSWGFLIVLPLVMIALPLRFRGRVLRRRWQRFRLPDPPLPDGRTQEHRAPL